MAAATSSRLLALLSLLQARRDWSGAELAARLEVSERTVRRDVERLRDLGYPVDAASGPAGGYRLRAGTAMPPLLLDDEEAVAIAVGLRAAAGTAIEGIEETAVRALVKLEQVLPGRLRRRVGALGHATTAFVHRDGPTVDPEVLTVLAGACRDRERVRFAYVARDGTDSRRLVEPCGLVVLGRRWYLVAWDCAREDWRTFRVDRLSRAEATGVRATPRRPPAEDLAEHVARSIRGMPHRHRARVLVHAPAEAVLARLPWAGGEVEPAGEDRCVYTTSDEQLEWLALRVGMLGAECEVLEPPELRACVEELAGRRARASRAPSR
jgi:predicted DNA-binding transcriptional regulator YafY